MKETFFGTLSPLLMLFLCIMAGFVLNKLKLLPESAAEVLSKCEKYLFVPALGYSTFSKYCTTETIRENINIVFYSLIAIVLAMIIALPLSKAFERNDINKRNIYKYALVFANNGFMGNAVIPLVLGGQEHLYKYLLFTLSINFMTYVWGVNILTPKQFREGNMFKNFLNAPLGGMALGVISGLFGIDRYMPSFVKETVDSLKNCMGPVAMILTGFVIGNFPVKSLIFEKKVYIATAFRLLIIPGIILFVLKLCGADNYILILATFAYATPLGLNTVVFPAAYGGDTKTGASMAMISHILCILTIPVICGILSFK